MHWKCPACHTAIIHRESEDRPRLGVRYRCHICRLELELDAETERLVPMPLRADEPNQKSRQVG
jgi:transposase-like protein